MGRMTKVTAAAAAALLVLGVAACGDDDDTDATTDTTEASTDTTAASAEGDNAAFCDSVVDFNNAAFQIDISEDTSTEDIKAAGETLAPLSAALSENAPADLADGAQAIDDFVQPLVEGDAEPFNADSTFETYLGFLGDATEACDFKEVDVEARDFAYTAPDTIEAGPVSFAFSNVSEGEEHEMAILQKADGVDLTWDEILDLPEDEGESKTKFFTAAYAPPGESSSTLADLEPGDYIMVCFIPAGGAEDGAPHFTLGMTHEFTVE